jgi:hypothetical protein
MLARWLRGHPAQLVCRISDGPLAGRPGRAGASKTKQVRQVLGDAEPSYSAGQEIALGSYGFRWLRLD